MDRSDTALKRAIDAGQAVGSPTNPDCSVAYYPQYIRNQQIAGWDSRCFAGVQTSYSVPCVFAKQIGKKYCDCVVAKRSIEKGCDTTQFADVQYGAHVRSPKKKPLTPEEILQAHTLYVDRVVQAQGVTVEQLVKQEGLLILGERECLLGCLADGKQSMDAGKEMDFLPKP